MGRSSGSDQEQQSSTEAEGRRWESEANLWRALAWTWAAALCFVAALGTSALTDVGWPTPVVSAVALVVAVVALRKTARARPQ